MINFNGLVINTLGELEIAMEGLEENSKIALRCMFNGEPPPPVQPTQDEMAEIILKNARRFGASLILKFVKENILMGITQAGKTRAVALACKDLQYFLETGSLYAAIEELEALRADSVTRTLQGTTTFLSNARLDAYKQEIKTYLGIP